MKQPSGPAGSGLIEKIDAAAVYVAARTSLRPAVGLVLGSGLGAFADTLLGATSLPYGQIPHFPVSTAVGHAGRLVLGTCRDVPVAVMAGRVHFYEGYSMEEVVFPVRVLGRLGVRVLVLTNAAGGVNTSFHAGDLMIITDHVNLMGTNPLIGPNEPILGERFFDMTEAYDASLRRLAAEVFREAGLTPRHGVYAGLTGPSYETPAEIRMLRALGADAVGMSTVPEVIATRHMGIPVLGISCITNMAAGVLDQRLDHKEVLEVGERVKGALMQVLSGVIEGAAQRA